MSPRQTPFLTIPQILPILASNPNHQRLSLHRITLPDTTDGPTFQVPLRNLELLFLDGVFGHLFALLRQLILPEMLDNVYLAGFDSTVEDVRQTLGPYMRGCFQRDARLQDRLRISSLSCGFISISVEVICAKTTALAKPRVELDVHLIDTPLSDALEQSFIDLIASVPQEHVVSFDADFNMKLPKELFFTMLNIEMLYLSDVELYEGFLQPDLDGPRANTKLFPSLRSLSLGHVVLNDGDWSHLTTHLAHQTSDNQIISFRVLGYGPYMPPEVAKEIEDLVEEFRYEGNPGPEGGASL